MDQSEIEVGLGQSTISGGSSAAIAVGLLPNIRAALQPKKTRKLVGSKE
ncbi:hypothetical protein TSMEX_002965 [Taenia solium]|eukprot:TsM_000347800 transcript=TsM_000347800 gene=TsM_000347800